jgi:hypothetical protein
MKEPLYILFSDKLNQFGYWVCSNLHIKVHLSGSIFFFLPGAITPGTIFYYFHHSICKTQSRYRLLATFLKDWEKPSYS